MTGSTFTRNSGCFYIYQELCRTVSLPDSMLTWHYANHMLLVTLWLPANLPKNVLPDSMLPCHSTILCAVSLAYLKFFQSMFTTHDNLSPYFLYLTLCLTLFSKSISSWLETGLDSTTTFGLLEAEAIFTLFTDIYGSSSINNLFLNLLISSLTYHTCGTVLRCQVLVQIESIVESR